MTLYKHKDSDMVRDFISNACMNEDLLNMGYINPKVRKAGSMWRSGMNSPTSA